MILGLSAHVFMLVHSGLSLVGILAGLNVLLRMVRRRPLGASNTIFLFSTILACVTGFFFPRTGVMPSHIVGGIALVALAAAAAALWLGNLYGTWRPIYVVGATAALLLNVLVAIAQAFGKVPALHGLAPTGKEPVVLLAQGVALLAFLILGYFAVKRFHPGGM
jgi:hypothetical protein